MKQFILIVALALGLTVSSISPVRAGKPDGVIGGINPNLYVCADPGHVIIDLESDAFDSSGNFDPDIEVDLNKLKKECDDVDDKLDARIELLQQSRIEGFVFEYHPDPAGPGGWTAAPSHDVPVIASGPGFETFRGSDKDGSYYFDYLGAGPVTLNLRLPPDAHPINPNVTIVTTSFAVVIKVHLGFYRGDTPPADFEALRVPAGYSPDTLAPPNTTIEDFVNLPGDSNVSVGIPMPSVGGILPKEQPVSIIALALIILVVLPTAGVLKLRSNRLTE